MKKSLSGQISLTIAIIGAIGMIGASALTGWFSASSKLNEAEKQISVIEERENNHYAEVQKNLTRIEQKLDMLIEVKK